ncbi:S1 family peptidase [Photobacterium angustum]|uniref:S1 family peptidase n=1 Tax=Photobacterium angustum TaxID=661 RepID=UPI0005DBEC21|nr:serine protease [Photobacterium angustum]KJG17860.1 serine protease [Photobacterium angustum]KJG24515.1 serine protease [Photobacterium angustum]KJG32796.1 serine protease [Photobacterium angustum]PSW97413.1 serine protease [Photobacterium angustum]PSX00397.1 serine protease [Photobacterium angustum]
MNKITTLGLAIAGILSFPLSATASESDISAYIIGGNEVQTTPEELSTVYIESGQVSCTGSLIAERWVLTAAHCIKLGDKNDSLKTVTKQLIKVYAGISNLYDIEPINEYKAVEVIVHPDYLPEATIATDGESEVIVNSPFVNDIALIAVSRNVTNAKIVSLPTNEQALIIENEIVESQQFLIAQGWGKTSNSSSGSSVLMEAELSYMSTIDCFNKTHDKQNQNAWLSSEFDPLKMCTYEPAFLGVCSGDSGGPLYYYETNGKKNQLGITSFGGLLCASGSPDVYTRVGGYDDWINNVITEKTPTLPAPVLFEDESTEKDNTDNTDNTDNGGGGGSVGAGLVMSLLAMGWLRRKRS